jgi:hypothetical protein
MTSGNETSTALHAPIFEALILGLFIVDAWTYFRHLRPHHE